MPCPPNGGRLGLTQGAVFSPVKPVLHRQEKEKVIGDPNSVFPSNSATERIPEKAQTAASPDLEPTDIINTGSKCQLGVVVKQTLKAVGIKLSQQLISGKEVKTAVPQENPPILCSRLPSAVSPLGWNKAARLSKQRPGRPGCCQRAATGSGQPSPRPTAAEPARPAAPTAPAQT